MKPVTHHIIFRALLSAWLISFGFAAQAQVTSTDGSFTAGGTTNMTFRTNALPRAIIDNAGNVVIGNAGSLGARTQIELNRATTSLGSVAYADLSLFLINTNTTANNINVVGFGDAGSFPSPQSLPPRGLCENNGGKA